MPVWQKEAVVIVKGRHIWLGVLLVFVLLFALFNMPTSVTPVSAQGHSANVPVWVNGELVLPAGEIYDDFESQTRDSTARVLTRAGGKVIVYAQTSYADSRAPWRRDFAIKETPAVTGSPCR